MSTLRTFWKRLLWACSGKLDPSCDCAHEPCCYLHTCKDRWCCDNRHGGKAL